MAPKYVTMVTYQEYKREDVSSDPLIWRPAIDGGLTSTKRSRDGQVENVGYGTDRLCRPFRKHSRCRRLIRSAAAMLLFLSLTRTGLTAI